MDATSMAYGMPGVTMGMAGMTVDMAGITLAIAILSLLNMATHFVFHSRHCHGHTFTTYSPGREARKLEPTTTTVIHEADE